MSVAHNNIASPHLKYRPATLIILAFATFFLGNHFFHNGAKALWTHPDQVIPIKVMETMNQHGDLNTDFARADIPAYFHAFRYNFAGYIQASYLAIHLTDPAALSSDDALRDSLIDISCWCAAITLVICLLLLACHLGILYGLLGALAVAVVPQLYQDAHYPRLESMSTMVFTLCFALATFQPKRTLTQILLVALIGSLVGFLTTIKFTYAISALFCIALAITAAYKLETPSDRLQRLYLLALTSFVAFGLGFAISSPAIILDISGYIAGIKALDQQYGGGHPPHGFITPSAIKQFGLISSYYISTLGFGVIFLHFIGYFRKSLSSIKFAYAIALAATFTTFVFQEAFFERNFSPFLPVFIMLSVFGAATLFEWVRKKSNLKRPIARNSLRILTASFVLVSLYSSISVTRRIAPHFSRDGVISIKNNFDRKREDAIKSIGAERYQDVGFGEIYARQYPSHENECILYSGTSFDDAWSARYYKQLPHSFKILERVASDFDDVPVSTLQTYISSTIYFFYDRNECTHLRNTTISKNVEPRG